jgi:hypothetical protein
MSNSNPSPVTRFQPGNTLGGRPKGARSRLGEKFLQTLADDFDEHGDAVMRTVRSEDPSTYLNIVAKLMPREVEAKLSVNQTYAGFTPDELTVVRQLLDTIAANAPGAGRDETFAALGAFLSREFARPVSQQTIALPPAPALCPIPLPSK